MCGLHVLRLRLASCSCGVSHWRLALINKGLSTAALASRRIPPFASPFVSSLAWRNCAVGLCWFLLGSFGRKIRQLCPTKRGNMQACETNMPSVDAQVNAASTDAVPASGALPAGLAAAAATSAAAGVNAAVASGAAVSSRDVASLRPNQRTRRVNVGGVPMGGGAPCVVQSMLNAPADDV